MGKRQNFSRGAGRDVRYITFVEVTAYLIEGTHVRSLAAKRSLQDEEKIVGDGAILPESLNHTSPIISVPQDVGGILPV